MIAQGQKSSEARKTVDVSVLIVNHSHRELLRKCLTALYQSVSAPTFRVVVLDNASVDESSRMVEEEFPHVHLIRQEKALGFSVNQNRMLRRFAPDSRYCLLLNDDATVSAQLLRGLVTFMDSNLEAGAASPQLLFSNGRSQFSGGAFSSLCKEFWRFSGLGRGVMLEKVKRYVGKRFLSLLPREAQQYLQSLYSKKDVVEVDYVSGCAMMLRAEALNTVGFLDERYYMYAEDLDWCYRAKQCGWRNYVCKKVTAIHYLRQSWSAESAVEYERSVLYFFEKYRYRKRAVMAYRAAMLFLSAIKMVYYWVCNRHEKVQAHKKIGKLMVAGIGSQSSV